MMEIVYQGRRTGKTTWLIEQAAESEKKGEVSYIVCHSQREAHRIAKKAQEMGLNIGYPITFDEFLNRQYVGQNIKHFFIDNAEYLLGMLTPVHIAAITLNNQEETDGSYHT